MAEGKENIVSIKSFEFSVRIVRLYQFLVQEKHEFTLSKQLLRSGTSIGANIREAECGSSRKDFINKLQISLKEANEAAYWIELLHATGYLTDTMKESIYTDCIELRRLLTQILKSTKSEPQAERVQEEGINS